MNKPTPGNYEYQVTRFGQVLSLSSNWRGYGVRPLAQFVDGGYLMVRLTINSKRKKFFVHRLVAANYLPPRPSMKHELRHLNGMKTDNRAKNLAWGTRKDNADDRARHGHTASGERLSIAVKKGIRASRNPYWKHARTEVQL